MEAIFQAFRVLPEHISELNTFLMHLNIKMVFLIKNNKTA